MRSALFYSLILLFASLGANCTTESPVGSASSSEESGSASSGNEIRARTNSESSRTQTLVSDLEEEQSAETESDPPDGPIESIYTDLDYRKCKKTGERKVDGEVYSTVHVCSGVAGYKLELPDTDLRQTVNVIYPDGSKHELRFGQVVSAAFSEVGDKAEWRVVKVNGKSRPIALIVRFNVSIADARPEDPPPDISFLTVSKITGDKACVTDVVNPGKSQNLKARELADSSASRPCRTKGVDLGEFIESEQ